MKNTKEYKAGLQDGYEKGLVEALRRHDEWAKWADKVEAPSEGRPAREFIRRA